MIRSTAKRDLHLQQGIVKKAEDTNVYEENGQMYLSVQHYTKIIFNILENDGTRHQL